MSDVTIARRTAIRMILSVTQDGQILSDLTSAGWFKDLEAPDRARAQRLATEVLRNIGRLDHVLKPMLRKRPSDRIEAILRLGTWELLADNAAAHGVVNDLVSLTALSKRDAGARGLVNAILRRVDQGPRDWAKLPVSRLPKWLRSPLMQAYGNSAIQSIEAAHARPAPIDISPKSDAAGWAKKLSGAVLPNGSVRLPPGVQITALEGFSEGAWWVQDAAAACPVQCLQVQPGETVLDLCAAPGGKTLQLAARGAKVTAVDASAARMERVAENLERTSLKADLMVGDVFDQKGAYDAVLLDAPCSATGTLRRHPDLVLAKDGTGISELIAQQSAMIDHAISCVRPGGRLVFATCSLLPDEGECQIEDLIARRPDLAVDHQALDAFGLSKDWVTEEGGVRLRPDYWAEQGGMDGFYFARVNVPA